MQANAFRQLKNTYGVSGTLTNVARRVFICICGMTASLAEKLVLGLAVGFFAMRTFIASARSIARVNQDKADPGKLRLVRDECSELRECPSAHLCSLRFSEPCPRTYPAQFFKRDASLRVCGNRNELLTDAMVFMFAKVGFFRLRSFQSAADSFRTLILCFPLGSSLLQRLAARVVTLTHRFNRTAGDMFAVRCRGQARNTQINADEIRCRSRGRVWQVNGYEQEPFTIFAENLIALSFSVRKSLALVCTHHERDKHTSLQGQEAHTVNAFETHHALVKRHRSVLAKLWKFLLIAFVGFAHLRDTAHGHLCRQAERISNLAVVELLQFNLIGRTKFKGFLCQPAGRLIEAGECFTQGNGLLYIRQQLNLQRQLHASVKVRNCLSECGIPNGFGSVNSLHLFRRGKAQSVPAKATSRIQNMLANVPIGRLRRREMWIPWTTSESASVGIADDNLSFADSLCASASDTRNLNYSRFLHSEYFSLCGGNASCNIAAFAAAKFIPMHECRGFLLRFW